MQNLRAKNTLIKMVANGGKSRSQAQAMRDAGYSESYARNPQKIKKTKAWQDYLLEYLHHEDICERHKALLQAHKLFKMTFPIGMTDNDIVELLKGLKYKIKEIRRYKTSVYVWYFAPDYAIQASAIDMAYKVWGDYKKGKIKDLNPLAELSDEELIAQIKTAQTSLRKS